MKILVTGSSGFVGKNLCLRLKEIKERKANCYGGLTISEVYEYDIDSTTSELEYYCQEADFVFNLAGAMRPQNTEDFMIHNFGFASTLLDTLIKHRNKAPVMLSSSIQASFSGRFSNSEYARSKKAGEDLFFAYGQEFGVKILVYRFTNIFGKWCRPNYNSVVATFCNNIANDLPININDSSVLLELLYIDDLVEEMILALNAQEHRCEFDGLEAKPSIEGRYCFCPITHKATVGEIAECLYSFDDITRTLLIPEFPADSFEKKLYSTFLSYLPKEKAILDLKMDVDTDGNYTELIRTFKCGHIGINILKPGVSKGDYWHHTKWEKFFVISGQALIQFRKLGTDEVLKFEVCGEKIQSVIMLPGYTHNIINLSDTEDLVIIMYCNEIFDPNRPDTFFEPIA